MTSGGITRAKSPMSGGRWLSAIGLACAMVLVATQPKAQENAAGYADLIARVMPGVVNISVKTMVPGAGSGAAAHEQEFVGSGFIIDPSGYIVTNRHVVNNTFAITVGLSDGTRFVAHVIGHPPATDVALLKVDAGRPLPATTLGDSDRIRVGDKVLAIGNPLGLGGTVTSGIVSALNRNTGSSPYDNYIQTDAAINHGNPGGPLFNTEGKVIGVNAALISAANETGSIGLGLAIPINDVKFAAAELREFGRVRPGWIGASLQQVTPDLAAAFGLKQIGGIIVAGVDKGSPAEDAGLQPGDLVNTFKGQSPRDVRALMRMIAESPLDHDATMAVHRADQDLTLALTVKEYPPEKMVADFPFNLQDEPTMEPGDVGLRVALLSAELRARFNLAQDTQAVEVGAVPPGSAADRARLQEGDVILRVQDHSASSPEIVEQELHRAEAGNSGQLALLVLDRFGPRWVALPVPTGHSH